MMLDTSVNMNTGKASVLDLTLVLSSFAARCDRSEGNDGGRSLSRMGQDQYCLCAIGTENWGQMDR